MRRRSSALGVFLGLVASLAVTSAAEAQQASVKRVATAETLPATAPAVAPLPRRKTPSASPCNRSVGRRQRSRRRSRSADRAALAAFYAGRVYAPVWVSSNGLNAKAAAAIAEFSKANDGASRPPTSAPWLPRRPAMRRHRMCSPVPSSPCRSRR